MFNPIRRTQPAASRLHDDADGDWLAEAGSREAAIELAVAELAEANDRLVRELRERHPELFDSDGYLIESEYRRLLLERGGTGRLTRAEILRTEEERRRQSGDTRSADAS